MGIEGAVNAVNKWLADGEAAGKAEAIRKKRMLCHEMGIKVKGDTLYDLESAYLDAKSKKLELEQKKKALDEKKAELDSGYGSDSTKLFR